MELLSKIHNYNLSTEGHFRIFGPPKGEDMAEPGIDCEIAIYNIPIDENETVLVAILLTFNKLYSIKFVTDSSGENKGMAFAKFTNRLEAERAIQKITRTRIFLHNPLQAKFLTFETNLYVGNINICRHSLYKLEQTLLRLATGLEGYVMYSLDKYNRYIIKLMFFTVEDLLVSGYDICRNGLFVKSPDIFISTRPPVARLNNSIPIYNQVYRTPNDFKFGLPSKIQVSHKRYNVIRIF